MPALTTSDIYHLSLTDDYAADMHMWERFNIRQLLGRFFPQDELETFRELQFETGMFISGSAALQFFDARHFDGSDLDLYVDHRYRLPIIHWIISPELGYRFVPPARNPSQSLQDAIGPIFRTELDMVQSQIREDGAYKAAASILTFVHDDRCEQVQLVTVHGNPLQMVFNFHSTCVMNIITHECAYSFYPDLTFIDRLSLYNNPIRLEERKKAGEKYEDRGWLCVPSPHPASIEDSQHSLFPGLRSVGDDRCWKVYLYPKQIRSKDVIINLNTWSQSFNNALEPTFSFSVVTAPAFNKDFLVGNTLGHALIHRLDSRLSNMMTVTLDDIDDAIFDSENGV